MEVKEYRLILCEEDIVLGISKSVRVLGSRLELKEVDNVYETYFYFGIGYRGTS